MNAVHANSVKSVRPFYPNGLSSPRPSPVYVDLADGRRILGNVVPVGPFQTGIKFGAKTFFVDSNDLMPHPVQAFGPRMAGGGKASMPDAPGGIGF
ncbi:Uncharacterised protein [uncultured archaeon]|nr:Uncharacterised protein [uncultured archaeon]